VNDVIPQDEPKDVNTVKIKGEITTSESEEKGVEDFNGVYDPGGEAAKEDFNGVYDPGGEAAKERINFKHPGGTEKQPGAKNDDPGDAKEDRYLSGIDPTAVYIK
jgi:hypothetical protein